MLHRGLHCSPLRTPRPTPRLAQPKHRHLRQSRICPASAGGGDDNSSALPGSGGDGGQPPKDTRPAAEDNSSSDGNSSNSTTWPRWYTVWIWATAAVYLVWRFKWRRDRRLAAEQFALEQQQEDELKQEWYSFAKSYGVKIPPPATAAAAGTPGVSR